MKFVRSGLDMESDRAITELLCEKWTHIKIEGKDDRPYGNAGIRCNSVVIGTAHASYLLLSVDESVVNENGALEIEIYKFILRRMPEDKNTDMFRHIELISDFDFEFFNKSPLSQADVMYERDCEDWTGEEIVLETVVGVVFRGSGAILFGSATPGEMYIFWEQEEVLKQSASVHHLETLFPRNNTDG